MSNVELLKLKDHLTITEAGDYLIEVMGVEEANSFSYIAGLVNEYKLNLYLNPDRFCEAPYADCGLGIIHSEVTLIGEQKFIKICLSSHKTLTIFDEGGTTSHSQEYSIFIDEGAKVEGDVFVGRAFECSDFEGSYIPPHLNDDEIAEAHSVACKTYKNKISEFAESLHQTNSDDSLFRIDGSSFLYIKRKEIDALLEPLPTKSASEPKQKPNKKRAEYKNQTQDRLILEQIVELGYSPTELPKREGNKAGVKDQVRKLLDGKEAFEAVTAFDDAWKRLRKRGMEGGIAELK